ncbi:MAG TPA: hypothetical protein VHJ82_03140, partial [Actinomycetota bacterium]|nr:hypothetical protein [Actinomycetota bacterium]
MQRIGSVGQAGPVLTSDKIRLAVERLLRTARSAAAGRSISDGANAIVSAAVQLTESEIAALIGVEEGGRAYTPLAWVGFPQSFLASGPVPSALSADVLSSPAPVVLTHSPFGEFLPELRHLTSHVVLPLRGR